MCDKSWVILAYMQAKMSQGGKCIRMGNISAPSSQVWTDFRSQGANWTHQMKKKSLNHLLLRLFVLKADFLFLSISQFHIDIKAVFRMSLGSLGRPGIWLKPYFCLGWLKQNGMKLLTIFPINCQHFRIFICFFLAKLEFKLLNNATKSKGSN